MGYDSHKRGHVCPVRTRALGGWGQKRLVQDEVWETVWEIPMPEELNRELLKSATVVKKHYKELDKIPQAVTELQNILEEEVARYADPGRLCP